MTAPILWPGQRPGEHDHKPYDNCPEDCPGRLSKEAPYVLHREPLRVPQHIFEALLRLAVVHERQVCDCENCTPEKAFPYDDCECGHDWSTCSEDVGVLDSYLGIGWRQQP